MPPATSCYPDDENWSLGPCERHFRIPVATVLAGSTPPNELPIRQIACPLHPKLGKLTANFGQFSPRDPRQLPRRASGNEVLCRGNHLFLASRIITHVDQLGTSCRPSFRRVHASPSHRPNSPLRGRRFQRLPGKLLAYSSCSASPPSSILSILTGPPKIFHSSSARVSTAS
jgi:hypothetical protein